MSNSPHMGHGKPMEDCRDYLRTGRCKYGASCKYNHPPNVQSGGGVKPTDPNEPMFPHRPNEPVCQYFMKHGTCKFGQSCKFHHPSQNTVQIVNGAPVHVMNVAGLPKREPAPQLMLNPVGTDASGQGMVLQFLPQRPDEPDCIYFLKNGRCKYGATCRYHHPIPPQQPRTRIDSKRRQQDPYSRGQKVQYVTQMVPSYSNQGQSVVVPSDSHAVTFLNVDGTTGPVPGQGYQIIPGSDGVTSYCVPSGSVVVTEQTSSASSIASSYETAQEQSGDSSQWTRSRGNGSGGSLNAYSGDTRQQRVYLPHSSSESNIARRMRATSYGSASDQSPNFYDASSTADITRNASAGSWTQRVQGSSDRPPVVAHVPRHQMMVRRSPRGGSGSDEGFTMMTSALLNMLDTPEEGVAESATSDDDQIDPSVFARMSIQDPEMAHGQGSGGAPPGYVEHRQGSGGAPPGYVEPAMLDQLSAHGPLSSATQLSPPSSSREEEETSWSPTWHGSRPPPDDETTDPFAMVHHHQTHPPGPNSDNDVGLYLP